MARANCVWVNPTKRRNAAMSSPDSNCPSMRRFRTRAGMALANCSSVSSGMSFIISVTFKALPADPPVGFGSPYHGILSPPAAPEALPPPPAARNLPPPPQPHGIPLRLEPVIQQPPRSRHSLHADAFPDPFVRHTRSQH